MILTLLLNIFFHEIGHSIPVLISGGSIKRIVIFGIELIPDFGRNSHLDLVAFFSPSWYLGQATNNFWLGLMLFSGSGFTLLISYISIFSLWFCKVKRTLRLFLIVSSFHFLDILTYSFLPLLGFPHRLIVGSHNMEPVEGLMKMGLSKTSSLLLILILILVGVAVYSISIFLKKHPTEDTFGMHDRV